MKSKSVIKRHSHYSIVIMRDDSNVHSFRMRSTTLRTLIVLYFLLLVLGGVFLGVGIHYWKRYYSVLPQFEEKSAALAELQLELAELRNFKTVATAHNDGVVPVAMNSEVGVDLPAEAASVGSTNSTAEVAGAEPAGESSGAQTNGTEAGQAAATGTDEPQPVASGEAGAGGQDILPRITDAASPVRIDNFTAQPYGQRNVRIRYLLTVAKFVESGQAGEQISGTASYVAVLKDGRRIDLELQVPGNAKFSISRMKTMTAMARLPEDCAPDDLQHIDVYVEVSDGPTFYDNYPFPQ